MTPFSLCDSTLLPYLVGFLVSSIAWAIACIWYARNSHKAFFEYGHRQYSRGYEHGRKSVTLYPHAK